MKVSPTAAAQMYPHLVKVECELHGEQQRAKVPQHLVAIFANRDNPDLVCKECLSDVKGQWEVTKRELKRKKAEAKTALRSAIKQTRIDAVASDLNINDTIGECEDAEETVKIREQELATTRSVVKKRNEQLAAARLKMKAVLEEIDVLKTDTVALSEKSLNQFEALEEADISVTACYNTLQEAVDSADQLWASVGKAARKKRDKANKRVAITLLRARNSKAEESVLAG